VCKFWLLFVYSPKSLAASVKWLTADEQ